MEQGSVTQISFSPKSSSASIFNHLSPGPLISYSYLQGRLCMWKYADCNGKFFEVAVFNNYCQDDTKILNQNHPGIHWMNITVSEIWPAKMVSENSSLNTSLSWCWLLPPLDHFPSAKVATKMAFWQNILSYMRTECCSELST